MIKTKFYKFAAFLLIPLILLSMLAINVSATEKQEKKALLEVVYFYSSKCLSCKENSDYVNKLETLSGINLIKYNTDTDNCQSVQIAYAEHFGTSEADALSVPAIYFGDKYFKLSPSNQNEVTKAIDDYISGRETFENFQHTGSACEKNFFQKIAEKMSVVGVLMAGLLDGINPCAISMLTVFYSFLLCTGDKKKTVLMSVFFILGIFAANFSFGLSVKTFYDLFAGNTVVLLVLYCVSVVVCITAIVLNTMDIINRHRNKGAKNQLPDRIKFKLSTIMRSSVFSAFAVPVALFVGFLIGVVELACTGQIYLPTLTYMISSGSGSFSTVMLLLAYNLMFVLPLIAITVIVGVVKKPETVKTGIMKKNHWIKIAANIFFVFMLIILIKEIVLIF